jgi:hypothetical protein
LGHEVLEPIKSLLPLRTLRFQEQFAPTLSPKAKQLPDVFRIGGPALAHDAKSTWEKSRMLVQKDRGTHVDPVHILYKNTPRCIPHGEQILGKTKGGQLVWITGSQARTDARPKLRVAVSDQARFHAAVPFLEEAAQILGRLTGAQA